MGATGSKPATSSAPIGADGKPKKICCACPETKRARDECVVEHGTDEDGKCKALIDAHLKCLRSEGFDV
jgi:cytochrome c oxidase assembly protein subunit 17